MRFLILALAILAFSFSPAQAKHRHHKHYRPVTAMLHKDCNVLWPCMSQSPQMPLRAILSGVQSVASSPSQILPHPAGCPQRQYCGCATAVHIFGKPIRSLWLASNWFRFSRTAPAPGMVAVKNHHVFAIESVIGDGIVMAYDPNSGGHLVRLHQRRLKGFVVVNPRSG